MDDREMTTVVDWCFYKSSIFSHWL